MQAIQQILRDSIGFDTASVGPSAIERAMRERLRISGLGVTEYVEYVRGNDAELQALIEEVVVPETWFLRDAAAFTPLVELAREEWLGARGRTLRILSLPCSTGEEPYSMAMALLDAGVPANRFTIDAVDISLRALERATRAIYGQNSFRGTPAGFRERYFDAYPGGHRLHERVRSLVRFRQGNLCQPSSMSGLGAYDVVFCRNLLIYFDGPTQQRAVDTLETLIVPQGLLAVGSSETHLLLARPAPWVRHPGSFAFRRLGGPPAPKVTRPRAATPVATSPPVHNVVRFPPRPAPAAPALSPAPVPLDDATRLADQGRFREAAEACERHLASHGPSTSAYQLLGILRDAMGDSQLALGCYRKALYLDPNNSDVLAHLALLLDRIDQQAEAELVRTRVARLANPATP